MQKESHTVQLLFLKLKCVKFLVCPKGKLAKHKEIYELSFVYNCILPIMSFTFTVYFKDLVLVLIIHKLVSVGAICT